MKKTYVLTLLFITTICAAQINDTTEHQNRGSSSQLTLLKHFTVAQMGAIEGQDSWGWTDAVDGEEYAIVGCDNGTAFIRVNEGTNAEYLGRMPSYTGSGYWRDVKVYNNHAYIVSDGNGNHGMQIFDLTRLRNLAATTNRTFNKNGDGHYSGISNAHNIIIDEDNGFLYILGSNRNGGAPRILDLSNPTNPTVAGNISSNFGYCHDAQVVQYDGPDPDYQGKQILIGSFSSDRNVKILDVTNKSSVSQISSFSYSTARYTHQGWFTDDKRFFILGDELDEDITGATRTFVFDLEDLDNPSLHYTHTGATGATDHNGYVRGNRYYLANYKEGAKVFKIDGLYDNTPSMVEVNYYDTMPGTSSTGTEGVWNVYPYLESGILITSGFGALNSNTDGGLFLVKDPNYDNTNPVASIPSNLTFTLSNEGSVTVTAADVSSSTDNIGIVSSKINGEDQLTFTCDDIGTQSITLVVADDYGLEDTVTGTITIEPNETVWTGSWDDNTPGPGSFAKISSIYSTATNGAIDACVCEVESSGTLTVNAGNYINVQKDITVNGILNVEHTANVVQQDADAQFTRGAGATIDVAITSPALTARDFMLLGSPMSAETNNVFNGASRVLRHDTSEFEPYTAEPLNGVNFLDADNNAWITHTGQLNPGEGYFVLPSLVNDGTYNYNHTEGSLNTGNIVYNAFYGDDKNDSPNMLANPYASAIDATMLINQNAAISEVYFWEHNTTPSNTIPGPLNANFSMQDVSLFNGTMGTPAASGGTTPNNVIATGQGFAIKANSPGGDVTFSNEMRLTSGNTTLRNPEGRDLLWIHVSENEYDLGSTTGIGFLEEASTSYDRNFDSDKLATVVSLYTHLEDGSQQLGIQGTAVFNAEMTIPMGFETLVDLEDHEYTISIQNRIGTNIESAAIYLFDNELNILTNISENGYTFKASAGVQNNRFTILFEDETFGTSDASFENIKVFPNPSSDIVTISSPELVINNIEIFDLRGRRIVNVINKEENKYVIDISSLETAIYYLTIETTSGTTTKKLIKR